MGIKKIDSVKNKAMGGEILSFGKVNVRCKNSLENERDFKEGSLDPLERFTQDAKKLMVKMRAILVGVAWIGVKIVFLD